MAERKVRFPIYVASKGRATRSRTLKGLEKDAVPYTVFVEPRELAAYRATCQQGTVHDIGDNDRGLTFVRQHILDYARGQGDTWYWMLDDDLTALYKSDNNNKVFIVPWWQLANIEPLFEQVPNVGQVSLEYMQFAWSRKGKVAYNSYADVAVCINVDACRGVSFDPQFVIKLDRDFTLQLLSLGFYNVRFTRYSVWPKPGEKIGGLCDTYNTPGLEEADIDRMVAKWGNAIVKKHRKPNGTLDAKINWRHFAIKK